MIASIIRLRFPDIPLRTRDGHKLRGYFGNLFREHSTLLHNHFTDGSLRYGYPLVQYKVLDGVANLIGINEGAELLTELFIKVKELDIDGHIYPIFSKYIEHYKAEIGTVSQPVSYQFLTPWMALNQRNYPLYKKSPWSERKELLEKILIGNILSFFKGVNVWVEQKLEVELWLRETPVNFKNKRMTGFKGKFTVNANIPDYLGIGKSVSRGFGAVKNITID